MFPGWVSVRSLRRLSSAVLSACWISVSAGVETCRSAALSGLT